MGECVKRVVFVLLGLVVLAACGTEASVTSTATNTAALPEQSSAPPASDAPSPTETVAELDSAAVVQAFQEAGLAAKEPRPMTRDDYGLGPLVGEGTRFLIPSLGPDAGGRVIVGTPEEMNKLADYYVSLGKESAAFFSHVFRSKDGSVVVQMNGELPDKQAEEYEAVVESL